MMSITSLRWATLAGILFWLLTYWHGGRKILIDIKEAARAQNSSLDVVLLITMTFCSFVIISMGFLSSFGWLQVAFLQNPILILTGTFLSIFGILGMFYCRRCLGRFWTAEINVTQSHQIIDTGPYRFIRHPIYTFAILMYAGFGLVFLSAWTMSFVGIIIAAYVLKTWEEDAFLEKNLLGYREYKVRVRYRLIPGLW